MKIYIMLSYKKTMPRQWMQVRPEGLYCAVGDVYIDPMRPVARAIVTHGHADHARTGHETVYATPETIAIMAARYGENFCQQRRPLAYGETISIDALQLSLVPAGHILGSAQAVLQSDGSRVVISGDFKRREDLTCAPFVPVPCDVFITEATFALPVFRHPDMDAELQKLLDSLTLFPQRCHLVGAYALGKAQRVMLGLRKMGYERPFYIHGAMKKLCALYQELGVDLGEIIDVNAANKKKLAGEIVLAPPSALADRWSRSLPDVLTCAASGWMQIRARAKQKLVELPLIISDHADWDELIQTIKEISPSEVWVTHGREAALIHEIEKQGIKAQALSLLGYEEENDD